MIAGTLAEAAQAMQGRLVGDDRAFRGVSTDTRSIRDDELFVALEGPHFDGATFVSAAAGKAAAGAVVREPVDSSLAQICVSDTLGALGSLAADWRRRMPARVVGLTGSNGKTTVKEMIASCLRAVSETLATEGNLNNEIGVPLTLLRLSPEHRFAVIEMGANHAGEIARLTACATPDVVALTNAGPAHLEGFGSIEGVAYAKGEILQGSPRPDVAVLNADDRYFDLWRSMTTDVSVLSFGTSERADVRADNIEATDGGIRFDLYLHDKRLFVELPLAGVHNAVNAAAAAAVATALEVEPEAIRAGLANTEAVGGRLRCVEGREGLRVFDDSYNANPSSVLAAAQFLGAQSDEGWLVLGDMAELGHAADNFHREIGVAARENGVARLLATGSHAKYAARGFGEGALWFENVDALIVGLRKVLPIDRAVNVLVKGSRSMRMEQVVQALTPSRKDGAGG